MTAALDRKVAYAAELIEAIPARGVREVPVSITDRYWIMFNVTKATEGKPSRPYVVVNDRFEREFEKRKWDPEWAMELIRDHGCDYRVHDNRKKWDAQQEQLASNAQEIRDADEARAEALAK